MRACVRFVTIGGLALHALAVMAHDNPDDVVDALTHRIDSNGPTARLLAARAFEYEYLGQWDKAAEDFKAALVLQPRYGAALSGLAETLLRQGRLEDAESTGIRGLELEETPDRRGPYYAIIAQARARSEKWDGALDAWRAALESQRPEVDWFLGEAEALAALDRYPERAARLGEAVQRNPSVVLERTWIWALVDAGQADEAEPLVERKLERAHWKSTWLLLRARIHALRCETGPQRADARTALEEINMRWSWAHPDEDPFLFTYAALAHTLLGEEVEAREALETARRLGIPERTIHEYEKLLPDAGATAP